MEPSSGRVPGTITVTPSAGPSLDYDIQLVYTGAAVVSPRGRAYAAGSAYPFGYGRYFVAADWNVRYFTFDETARPDPRLDDRCRQPPAGCIHDLRPETV